MGLLISDAVILQSVEFAPRIAKLDEATVFVAFLNGITSNPGGFPGSGMVLSLNGSQIVQGAPTTIEGANIDQQGIDVIALTPSSVLLAYTIITGPSTGELYLRVCTINSQGGILLGDAFNVTSANQIIDFALAPIDATHAFLTYKENQTSVYKGYAVRVTIAGTTPSVGTRTEIFSVSAAGSDIKMETAPFSATSIAVVYSADSSPSNAYAVLCAISGGSITAGSPVSFDSISGTPFEFGRWGISILDSTTLVIGYSKNKLSFPYSAEVKAILGKVNGTVIDFESSIQIEDGVITYEGTGANPSVERMTGNDCLLSFPFAFDQLSANSQMKYYPLKRSDTTLRAKAPVLGSPNIFAFQASTTAMGWHDSKALATNNGKTYCIAVLRGQGTGSAQLVIFSPDTGYRMIV